MFRRRLCYSEAWGSLLHQLPGEFRGGEHCGHLSTAPQLLNSRLFKAFEAKKADFQSSKDVRNNTDPFQRLVFDPVLNCACPDDLAEWPQGYNQTGVRKPKKGFDLRFEVISNSGPEQEGEWYCEDGYGGTPQAGAKVFRVGLTR